MKAVIFDMDGVIVDTESIHADMKIRTLNKYGIPCSMEDCVAYAGRSAKAFFRDFVHLAKVPTTVTEMIDHKHKIYLDYVLESNVLRPVDGVVKLLEGLKNENIPMALASSSDRMVINAVLGKLGLLDYFQFILSGAELQESKPDPTIYRMAAERLGFKPEECVVIEDATAGIEAGRAAGCYTIAVDNPNSGPQDLSKADRIVESIGDIDPKKLKVL